MRCASPGATAPSSLHACLQGRHARFQGAGYMLEPQAGCNPRSLVVKARMYPCDDLTDRYQSGKYLLTR